MATQQYGRLSSWIGKHLKSAAAQDDLQESVFKKIRENLSKNNTNQPVVSIVIVARNEEQNLLSCISSLSEQVIHYPFEIIVCNNNSTDRTQDIIDRCGVNSIFQPAEGTAYAREAGMWIARGKYHLCAQANCLYPPDWAARMIEPLEKGEAICTVGDIGRVRTDINGGVENVLTGLLMQIKAFVNVFRRPDRVVNGGSMAFFTRMGQQVGWRKDVRKGEERHMVISMARYGKVKYINNSAARPLKIHSISGKGSGVNNQAGTWAKPTEFHEFILN